MRRIYESRALHRDGEDPFAPAEDDDRAEKSRSAIDWDAASHALVPTALRNRAVEVSVETDRKTYAVDEPVAFRVTLRNRIPFPVALKTRSPVLWSWAIDGVREASHVREASPPDRPGLLSFDRSERKIFERRWLQRVRTAVDEWSPVGPGEYALSAAINVADAEAKDLAAETTVRVV